MNSQKLFDEAQRYIPGGVNSPVRAFKSVGGIPLFVKKGKGCRIWDVDGNEYIDFVGSWGPLILGHAHPKVVEAIQKVAAKGTSFGAPYEMEVKLAQLITELVPSIEMVRMVNSGTEATMSAIRLARAYTGRDKVIKFEGCYHGHGDSFLIKAGSGATTLGVPSTPGVTRTTASDTLNAQYNDLDSVLTLVDEHKGEIAAIIVEPIAANMGVVLPKNGFLQGLREIATKEHILLIFDEVITGFRVSLGGAQQYYGVEPDLTTLGKIIGGGLPVGAYGGKKEIMQLLAPSGPVYQAGTLSGNPLAMTAGYETLRILQKEGIYEQLQEKGRYLFTSFVENFRACGLKSQANWLGSIGSFFFTDKEVVDYETALTSDTRMFAAYFWEMLKRGIYLAPSQFEAMFISLTHLKSDLERTVEIHRSAVQKLAE